MLNVPNMAKNLKKGKKKTETKEKENAVPKAKPRLNAGTF